MRKGVIIGTASAAGAVALVCLLLIRPRIAQEETVLLLRSSRPAGKAGSHPGGFPRWVRRFDRRMLNPLVLLVAGRRHSADYAILHHVGRRSGRAYATPVVAHACPGGYLIALPYGVDTDWCRNLLVAGQGTLKWRGNTYRVGEPEVIDTAAASPLLFPRVQRALRPFKIQHFLKLRQLMGDSVTEDAVTAALTAAAGH
jgi:deazaflavin-dependent oxidoreductase (nitroreductase family)